MDDSMNNIKENFNNAKTQYEKLKEKSKLYKLKRWEKNIIINVLIFYQKKEYKEKIKK